jgi:tetratricopeptide (TPR) repeat protein
LFAQAVELDPDFSAAWSGKAFNASLLSGYSIGTTHQEGLDKTLEAAGHALELDPENAEAYTAIGRVMSDDMQWEEARKNFERAFELDPNDVGVLNLYADFLGLRLGDFDRGISLEQQAISLDPLSGVHASDLADLLLVKGQFEDAVVSARRGVSLAPDSAQRMYSFVESLVKSGKLEEAASLLKRLSTPDPEYAVFKSSLKQWWAAYYYASDDLESLQTFVAECIQTKESGAEDPNCMSLSFAQIAYFSMRWQDPASVVPWLEKSLEERESDLTFPLYFYLPERISDDPRWLEFWNQPVLKALLDIRRANPYPSNGLSRAKSEISGTDK